MYLVGKDRHKFFFFPFLLPVIYRYGDFQAMFRRTLVCTLHRGTIGKAAANSQAYMLIADNAVIGGIQTQPAIERNIRFHPGVGGAFATEFMVLGTDITTHISGGNTGETQHHEQYMREVLAYTGFELPDLIHPGFHAGDAFFIFKISKDKIGHLHRGSKGGAVVTGHGIDQGNHFIKHIKIFQQHKIHIGKLLPDQGEIFPLGIGRGFIFRETYFTGDDMDL